METNSLVLQKQREVLFSFLLSAVLTATAMYVNIAFYPEEAFLFKGLSFASLVPVLSSTYQWGVARGFNRENCGTLEMVLRHGVILFIVLLATCTVGGLIALAYLS